MYTATLIAAPERRNLDPALTESLRNAWGGRDVVWLSPDEAADFMFDTVPENRWHVWQELQLLGVDLVIQPAKGRRKRMLIADMDSTLIEQECINELAAEAGVGPRVAEITARAMNGEIDFETALLERVGLLRGLPVDVIDKVLTKRITMMPGAAMLVRTMKAQGAYTVLVSGGFTAFAASVARQLGIQEHRANTLLESGGELTGDVARPILGFDAKVQALREVAARLNITTQDVLAVGDGANDLGMLHQAGAGVALHAKPAVAEQCDLRINHGDLTALLYLQGYRLDEFESA